MMSRMIFLLVVSALSFSSLSFANMSVRCCNFSNCDHKSRNDFVYYPGMTRITEDNVPDITNKSYTINADVEVPEKGSDGIIVKQGGRFGGWGLLVLDGKPLFVYAATNQPKDLYRIQSSDALIPGTHHISFDFKYDGGGVGKGGEGTLKVDGKVVAEGRIAKTVRFSKDDSFDVGMDSGTPVIGDYEAKMPFTYTGILKSVRVHLSE